MTHSTCCKAEVEWYSITKKSYRCTKCGQPCDVASDIDVTLTPPLVPSEIEEEIGELIYENIFCNPDCATMYFPIPFSVIVEDTGGKREVARQKVERKCDCGGVDRRNELVKSLTSLLTHHTQEKVREERKRIEKEITSLRIYKVSTAIDERDWAYLLKDVNKVFATLPPAEGEGE